MDFILDVVYVYYPFKTPTDPFQKIGRLRCKTLKNQRLGSGLAGLDTNMDTGTICTYMDMVIDKDVDYPISFVNNQSCIDFSIP